jgi:ATP/ADP translocase
MIQWRLGSGTKTRRFYDKYRNYILFNKNIILSGTVAFFVGALSTQLYAQNDSNNLANSIVTLSIEYGIYIPLFAILFYMDNKQRYIDPVTQKKDYSIIKGDIKKMVAAFTISELIYSVAKLSIHYGLLQNNIEPYQASMIGALAAWALFLVAINLGIKAVRLFRS